MVFSLEMERPGGIDVQGLRRSPGVIRLELEAPAVSVCVVVHCEEGAVKHDRVGGLLAGTLCWLVCAAGVAEEPPPLHFAVEVLPPAVHEGPSQLASAWVAELAERTNSSKRYRCFRGLFEGRANENGTLLRQSSRWTQRLGKEQGNAVVLSRMQRDGMRPVHDRKENRNEDHTSQ